jgi:hypothetical protein
MAKCSILRVSFGTFERVVETGFGAFFDAVDDFVDFFLRSEVRDFHKGFSVHRVNNGSGLFGSFPLATNSILDFVRLGSRNGERIYSSKLLKRREGIVDRRTRQSVERTPELA